MSDEIFREMNLLVRHNCGNLYLINMVLVMSSLYISSKGEHFIITFH